MSNEFAMNRLPVKLVFWTVCTGLLVGGCRPEADVASTTTKKKYEVAEDEPSVDERPASPVPAPGGLERRLSSEVAGVGVDQAPPPHGASGLGPAVAPMPSRLPDAGPSPPAGSAERAPGAAPSLAPAPERTATAESGAATPAAPQPIKPPAVSREQIENLEPPDGPPEAILAFIEGLNSRRPRGRTQGEVLQDIRRMLYARVAAAQKLFDHPQADRKMRQDAVDVVLTSFQYLTELGAQDVLPAVRAFCTKMAADPDPEFAATGRLMIFSLDVGDLLDDKIKDPTAVMAAAEQLLAKEQKTANLFEHLRTAALGMLEGKHRDSGLKLVQAIVQAFAEHPDPALARQVKLLQEEARFLELDLGSKLLAFARHEPNSLEQLLAGTQELLTGDQLGLGTLQQASFIGDTLERNNQLEEARKVFKDIGTAFASSSDPELQKLVKETVEFAERRLGLINKPFVPTGTTFDGRPFQWEEYQGKVVLIAFWSAENPQYLASEVPQLKRLREVYKDRGFEVIGVNIDSNRRLVEQFLGFQPLPWVTIMDGSDGKGKLLNECGVRSIPFTLLINQQGIVTDLHVTAQTLPEKLLKMLAAPPPDKRNPPATPDTVPQGASRSVPDGDWFFVAYVAREAAADAEDQPPEPGATSAVEDNPYLAPPDVTRQELVRFLEKMAEKPASIRMRPGFDEALIDAAERILREGSQDAAGAAAIECLLRTWHRLASKERPGAQEQLIEAINRYKADTRPAIAAVVQWLSLEQQLLQVDQLPLETVPELLAQLEQFTRQTKPGPEHLRMASAAVHAVNRLEVDKREPYFQMLAKWLTGSTDRDVVRYGRQVGGGYTASNAGIVGQVVELSGITSAGVELKWNAYQDKVVIVDFWATWCGPCVREMPKLRALYDQWKDKGVEVIGVNLDRNPDAVARFLEQQELPWPNIVGQDAAELARRYGVQSIPWLWLVDRQGRVVKAVHHADELTDALPSLLQGG